MLFKRKFVIGLASHSSFKWISEYPRYGTPVYFSKQLYVSSNIADFLPVILDDDCVGYDFNISSDELSVTKEPYGLHEITHIPVSGVEHIVELIKNLKDLVKE